MCCTLEAYAELEVDEAQLSFPTENRDVLFADYLKEYLKFIEPQLDPNTYQGYQFCARCHIIPLLRLEK